MSSRALARGAFPFLALLLVLAGVLPSCSSPASGEATVPASSSAPRSGAGSSPEEALYRHLIISFPRQQDLTIICLGAGAPSDQLKNPEAQILASLEAHRPEVRGVSDCRFNGERWVESASGLSAILFYIRDLRCSADECVGRAGYLGGNLSASGSSYQLRLASGQWTVTGETIEWVS